MPPSPPELLPAVIDLAEQSGRAIAAEFRRPDGPRFADHVTAPIDHEVELFLRERLTALLPARFVGEEAGVLEADPNGYCWVVDPHDGTRAYLEGRRGSAVSIALLHQGEPVLGVVYAPLSPDRGPDMIAWAAGGGITRNGAPVAIDLRRRELGTDDVVFLNHGAWQRPVWHGAACAPGRFMPLPSIAYRLARVAVGDGVATLTLRPVNALDVVAGHALLTAAGGVLVAEDGAPVTYNVMGESRPSACFGGAPPAVATLRARTWRGSTEERRAARVRLDWPRVADDDALDRAIGAMLGLLIGDSREARNGGLAGQPGPDGEAALAVARALVAGDPLPATGPLGGVPLGIAGVANDPISRAIAAGVAGVSEEDVRSVAGAAASREALRLALRGVAHGRSAFTPHDALAVLTCRPEAGLGVAVPRPEIFWPDDLIDLTEALLLSRHP